MSITRYHGSHSVGVMDNPGKLDHRTYRITKAKACFSFSVRNIGLFSPDTLRLIIVLPMQAVQYFHISNVSNFSTGSTIIIILDQKIFSIN